LYFQEGQPSRGLIEAIIAMKQSNPIWGGPKIAQRISLVLFL
jgi:hypothetical protein